MSSIKRILVPVDFSPSSRAAVEHARLLGVAFGAAVEVLYVHEPSACAGPHTLVLMPVDFDGRRWETTRDEILRDLGSFLGAERDGVKVRVESGLPSQLIPELARGGGFDLIVMGTHGRSGHVRAAVGSVSEAVMRRAHCPVTTVHVPERAAREAVPM